MAVSQSLRRLLRIRELEEDQRRAELATATADLRRLQAALKSTAMRDRRGRKLVGDSARSGELTDRLAGLEESRAAKHHAQVLQPRIVEVETVVSARRQQLIDKRIERRQVETVLQKQESVAAIESGRRAQAMLDDWYLSRLVHKTAARRGTNGCSFRP